MSKLFTNDRYLRGRPFFILYVTNSQSRKTDAQRAEELHKRALGDFLPAQVPSYNGNPDTLKQVSRFVIADRVSSKQEAEAHLILDIVNMKIIKNRNMTADAAMEYLSATYSDEIGAAMEAFIRARAKELKDQGITAEMLMKMESTPDGE